MTSKLFINFVDPIFMASALSKLPNQAETVGVPNQTTNAHMFTL
jgi:hypothetical protein